jgi:hypothetical protein
MAYNNKMHTAEYATIHAAKDIALFNDLSMDLTTLGEERTSPRAVCVSPLNQDAIMRVQRVEFVTSTGSQRNNQEW